ncbi:predicted protein [Plenodomus lingam JN3]|uniref:Predicted protein n=1 Tax=Leptosphaeria maculans (strain JN3 / isolate v23.1.3 / race Av1-4-5-6-7-8) TaxID=985895 RepID=E4ZTB5_LEPMJ|nr:predicted protein [Plenodomus lingam JN3]CBX94771.1 predicted protein [Plenodomus lingam JN3]
MQVHRLDEMLFVYLLRLKGGAHINSPLTLHLEALKSNSSSSRQEYPCQLRTGGTNLLAYDHVHKLPAVFSARLCALPVPAMQGQMLGPEDKKQKSVHVNNPHKRPGRTCRDAVKLHKPSKKGACASGLHIPVSEISQNIDTRK